MINLSINDFRRLSHYSRCLRPSSNAAEAAPTGYCWILTLWLVLSLTACDQQHQETSTPRPPQAIQDHEECHVCGMVIHRFPGPKGEALLRRQPQALKFCSTRDLFAWLLQPESAALVETVYVHDMAQTDWDHPEDSALVDARGAWYVAGGAGHGAMGPSLASFATRADAEAYAETDAGRVMTYGEITLELLGELE